MTTAARPPQQDISLDTLPMPTSLGDYQRADAALVRTIEANQHALMSGWGTPSQVMTYRSSGASIANLRVLLRVPPFVTRFRVAVLGYGPIEFSMQVGGFPLVKFEQVTDAPQWVEGSPNETFGNDDGFLRAVATQSANWQTVTVTTFSFGDIFGLAFYPILEQAV